jgi:sugar-specific transcriptional regulator TrmB
MKEFKEFIDKLETLGFTIYESKVFISLLKGYNMSAPEVAESAKIPKSSAYDILKSFSEKGYCNEIQTPSKIKYEMIDPEIVKGKLENELDRLYSTKLKVLNSSFEKFTPLYKSEFLSEGKVDVELIKGFNLYRFTKFLDLLKSSKDEMLLMNRLEGHVSKDLDVATKMFFKKGGKIRSIYEASLNFKFEIEGKWVQVTQSDLIELCEKFQKEGEQIRLADKVPQNMAIFDRKIVFISLVDKTKLKNNRTDVIIRNEEYAANQIELFDMYWNKSSTIDNYKKIFMD